MHKEILGEKQVEILDLLEEFADYFGLVGGTAIALQIGHRRSIDFDFFSLKSFDHEQIRKTIRSYYPIQQTIIENPDELTVIVNQVRLTFYTYPFEINFSERFDTIRLPHLLTLAAMKAFALGKRAKWKDYVDLYFIFQKFTLKKVTDQARSIFGSEFNEKLFREQLAYFEDIDYSETIDYMDGFVVADDEIKSKLIDISLEE